MKRTILNLSAVVAIVFITAVRALGDVTLVDDGRLRSVLVLPSEPTPHEQLAAAELQTHLEKMSGAKLETAVVDAAGVDAYLRESKSRGMVPIFIGRNVRDRLAEQRMAEKIPSSEWHLPT